MINNCLSSNHSLDLARLKSYRLFSAILNYVNTFYLVLDSRFSSVYSKSVFHEIVLFVTFQVGLLETLNNVKYAKLGVGSFVAHCKHRCRTHSRYPTINLSRTRLVSHTRYATVTVSQSTVYFLVDFQGHKSPSKYTFLYSFHDLRFCRTTQYGLTRIIS